MSSQIRSRLVCKCYITNLCQLPGAVLEQVSAGISITGAVITTASATGAIQDDDTPNLVLGTTGNDILVGTSGADTLIGLTGNDFYVVNTIGDVVFESSGSNEGRQDAVIATINYTLPNDVENLTLDGSLNLQGTGSSLNNKIVGNTGRNILNGGAGADTLTGGAEADTLVFNRGESTVNLLGSIVLTD